MLRFTSGSERETEALGERLGARLRPGCVVALKGGMGAGKTALVRGIARGLGFDGRVTSPTYAIVNEYPSDPPLFHFDLYRLSGADELFDIGFEEYLERGGVCVIEWADLIEELLPEHTIRIEIQYGENEGERIYRCTC